MPITLTKDQKKALKNVGITPELLKSASTSNKTMTFEPTGKQKFLKKIKPIKSKSELFKLFADSEFAAAFNITEDFIKYLKKVKLLDKLKSFQNFFRIIKAYVENKSLNMNKAIALYSKDLPFLTRKLHGNALLSAFNLTKGQNNKKDVVSAIASLKKVSDELKSNLSYFRVPSKFCKKFATFLNLFLFDKSLSALVPNVVFIEEYKTLTSSLAQKLEPLASKYTSTGKDRNDTATALSEVLCAQLGRKISLSDLNKSVLAESDLKQKITFKQYNYSGLQSAHTNYMNALNEHNEVTVEFFDAINTTNFLNSAVPNFLSAYFAKLPDAVTETIYPSFTNTLSKIVTETTSELEVRKNNLEAGKAYYSNRTQNLANINNYYEKLNKQSNISSNT